MWLKHHVFENPILNQGCSQKYNYNENIHVDNNKIRTLEIMPEKKLVIAKMEQMSFQSLFKHIYTGTFSQFVGQQFVPHCWSNNLKMFSYCDVLYHEQVHSECLLCVMFVLP